MDARKSISLRVNIIYGLMCLFGIAIVAKIVHIQFVKGNYWIQKAETLTLDYRNIDAQRGNIYASDGSLLSTSLPIFDLRMDFTPKTISKENFENNLDSICYLFSEMFKDKSKEQYKHEFKNARKHKSGYLLIKRNVSYSQYKQMKQWPLFRLGRYKSGLITIKKSKREKPFQNLAARTLGYYIDGNKPVGIEGAFNKYLSGVSGKKLMQKMAGNVWMPVDDNNEVDPKDGSDIVTTLDINIQDATTNALKKQLIKSEAKHGTAVVMEVSTGEIKAIANLAKNESGEYTETYNYAIGGRTDPGSTFKLMSIMTALEDNLVKLTDSVDLENGRHVYYDETMKDSEEHKERTVSIKRAFEISSNVGISKVLVAAYSKKPENFINRLNQMSLNQKIGLQIPGETPPVIKSPKDKKNWSGTTLPWMSIGYELNLTPLQILTFYNAVANNGKMIKPFFVKEIRERGKLIKSFSTEVINESIASENTLKQAKELLEGVVERGTAMNIKSENYKIAGKTGTTQLKNEQNNYKSDTLKYQASFAGYFPAENPRYSIIVVVNGPNGSYYGSAVAAPVFREIADKIYSTNLDIKNESKNIAKNMVSTALPSIKPGYKYDLAEVCAELGIKAHLKNPETEWAVSRKGDKPKDVTFVGRKIKKDETPNVVGMGMRDAIYILESAGLQTRAFGRGTVLKQSPEPGSKLEKGKLINIFLG